MHRWDLDIVGYLLGMVDSFLRMQRLTLKVAAHPVDVVFSISLDEVVFVIGLHLEDEVTILSVDV